MGTLLRTMDDQDDPKKRISTFRRLLGLIVGLPVVGFFLLLQFGVYKPYRIVTASMLPTFEIGDCLLIRAPKNITEWHNRVVIFPDPTRPSDLLIKRVVAVGGEQLEFRNGRLFRSSDNTPLTGGYLRGKNEKWSLEADELFVLGDNTQDSFDSINFGPIRKSDVKGIPFYRYWPIHRAGWLE